MSRDHIIYFYTLLGDGKVKANYAYAEHFHITPINLRYLFFLMQSPHCANVRGGVKFGDLSLTDSMMQDGLTCAFNDCHMGITAENVARQKTLSRQEQDQFSAKSQNKAESAQKKNLFTKEIVPVSVPSRKG